MLFEIGDGRYRVTIEVIELGKDLVVIFSGGDKHIGAVSLSLVRKSLRDPGQLSASNSLLTVPGHKEEDIAIPLAKKITSRTGRNCVLVAGIHLDNITNEELDTIWENCQEGAEKVINNMMADKI